MARSFHLASLALVGFALAACTTTTNTNTNGGGSSGTPNGDNSSSGGDGVSQAPGGRFFLPTGAEADNTSAPRIEVDSSGGIHAIYPAYARGGAYYAYCPADCAGTADVKVVRFETQGTVGNAMIALDARGKPQILLSAYSKVYYGACTGDCTTPDGWNVAPILDHGSEKEVTGEAFALDPQGRPRFLMHTYVAYLGIGQKPFKTELVACDADCTNPASWRASTIGTDNFERSQLRYDAQGRAHVATIARLKADDGSEQLLGAYQYCAADCEKPESWTGPGLGNAFSDHLAAVEIKPQINLALTKAGQPRIVFLMKDDAGKKLVAYFECDESCTSAETWTAIAVSDHEELSSGFDLALDADGHPRIAFSLNYNIGVAYCDQPSCTAEGSKWDLTVVERGSDMPPDTIFLEPNCTVGAWFLHDPSIALTPAGQPRIGYQARDISGGWKNPDPTKPDCTAGTDMTWSRLAILPSL